ncbi:uncharacterized protein HGUI_02394 [Hanseniaspora guilliermondii]|uniref:Uncharacterized protein n=1 Tax=Hanseniaspora guilliermondii TaxID=56406 RepID=A0A1L0B1A9_9ASCO|nr:uncharacterized protein HGUI_02394 [Hanseniaspora guilliermondii]
MFDHLIDEVNFKIWLLLPLKDRLNLLLLNKKINQALTKFLYKNIYLNTHKIITKDCDNVNYTGEFSSYSFLATNSTQPNEFVKTRQAMKFFIRSLESNPSLITHLEKIVVSWHIPVYYKTKIVTILTAGIEKDGNVYKPLKLKSLENEMNKDLFLKFINNCDPRILKLQSNLTIPHYDDKKGVHENINNKVEDGTYYKQIGSLFMNGFIQERKFHYLQSLDIHFNPIAMGFCRGIHLNLKSLTLNIRLPDKINVPQNYQCGDINLSPSFKWDDFLNVKTLRSLDLVSWIPEPSREYLKEYKLLELLEECTNLQSLKTFSVPYDPQLMKYVLTEMSSLERLRIDILDLTFSFTRLFLSIFEEGLKKRFEKLSHSLKSLHIELLPSSYRDPDFLIQLLRNSPEFLDIRSVLPCTCDDCIHCLKNLICKRIFQYEDHKFIFDEESKTLESYDDIHILFKKLNSITPYKSNFKNLFFQYGVPNIAKMKKNFGWEYNVELTNEDIESLYQFMFHFYKRSINFMRLNFPKLEYLNLNDLCLEKKSLEKSFEFCFSFEELLKL